MRCKFVDYFLEYNQLTPTTTNKATKDPFKISPKKSCPNGMSMTPKILI